MSETVCKHPDLWAEIEAFRAANDLSRSRFGENALNDPALIPDLERGREFRQGTIEAIRRYISTGAPKERGAACRQPV